MKDHASLILFISTFVIFLATVNLSERLKNEGYDTSVNGDLNYNDVDQDNHRYLAEFKCFHAKEGEGDDQLCRKENSSGMYNNTGDICQNFEPKGDGNCTKCSNELVSEGNKCYPKCSYSEDKQCRVTNSSGTYNSSGIVCENYEPKDNGNCTKCKEFFFSLEGKKCYANCTYNKNLTDNNRVCKKTDSSGSFNDSASVCINYEPKDNGDCIGCSGFNISLDGKKCYVKCIYNTSAKDNEQCKMSNKSGQYDNSNPVCNNYEPNFKDGNCLKCANNSMISIDGKKCVIKCLYNPTANDPVCKLANSTTGLFTDKSDVCVGYEPDKDGNCIKCNSSMVSIDGRKCVPVADNNLRRKSSSKGGLSKGAIAAIVICSIIAAAIAIGAIIFGISAASAGGAASSSAAATTGAMTATNPGPINPNEFGNKLPQTSQSGGLI